MVSAKRSKTGKSDDAVVFKCGRPGVYQGTDTVRRFLPHFLFHDGTSTCKVTRPKRVITQG